MTRRRGVAGRGGARVAVARQAARAAVRGDALAPARRGSTLIEIMIAMVLFALLATSHATLTLRYATRVKTVAVGSDRAAVLAAESARLSAVPFDSVSNRAGCVTVTGRFPYTRCITVTTPTGQANQRTVRIVLTPAITGVKPDTLFMTRARPAGTNVLGP